MNATAATGTDETTSSRPKNLTVSAELHTLLKRKAKAEGRVLTAMVEAKLWELVQPELIPFERPDPAHSAASQK